MINMFRKSLDKTGLIDIAYIIQNQLFRVIYSFFLLLPIKRNKIYVNCFDGMGYGDNPREIVEELSKLISDIDVVWLYKGMERHIDVSDTLTIRHVKPKSIRSMYEQATAKIWIATVRMPLYSIKRKEQLYFQTWHGSLGIKKVEQEVEDKLSKRYVSKAKHDSKMIDFYLSPNKDTSNLFKNNFWFKNGEIKEVGSPRNDVLINSTIATRNAAKKRLGINETEKVVLYAPTFRANGELGAYNLDVERLSKVLEKKFGGSWCVYVRLHPNIANDYKSIRKLEKAVNLSAIADAQEVLLATDILITDYSSIGFDFMSMKKPVFLYATDIVEYRKDRDFHVTLEKTPFPIAKSNDELEEIILRYNFEAYLTKLNTFKQNYGFIENGISGYLCAEIIKDSIKDNNLMRME